MKIRMISMALAALLCLASCSDDDSGIQLTEDEVVGDIITGKQIVINTLTTYTDGGCKVKVKCYITKNYHFLRTYTIPAFIWASIVFMSIPNRIIYSLIILLFSLSVIRLLL